MLKEVQKQTVLKTAELVQSYLLSNMPDFGWLPTFLASRNHNLAATSFVRF